MRRWQYLQRLNLIAAVLVLLPQAAFSASYYIDATGGNDGNAGTSEGAAWRSISKIAGTFLRGGDRAYLKRGSTWNGGLTISSSASSGNPIIVAAYGTGAMPTIKGGSDPLRLGGSYIEVDGLKLIDGGMSGIEFSGNHCTARNCEVTNCGTGFSFHGTYNLVTKSYAHDLKMIVDNPGGDNDYGAVGIWLWNDYNEASYCRLINCKAHSYDYGSDGGTYEWYGDVDNCYIHHCYGENNAGTFEAGGKGQTLSNNTVAYNISVNCGGLGGFHVGGNFGVYYENFRVENNTYVQMSGGNSAINFFNGTPTATSFIYKNNIIYLPGGSRAANNSGFTHQNNLFYLGGKTDVGITLGPGDKIGDPLFVDVNAKNFHLKPNSPAINAGANLNYKLDFENNPVPSGSAPDIGAFEYGSSVGLALPRAVRMPWPASHELQANMRLFDITGRKMRSAARSGAALSWRVFSNDNLSAYQIHAYIQ